MTLDLPLEIPLQVKPNSKIYKDECMYTFDTPTNNPLGLDVDLISYQAFSRTPDYNYTKENYKNTGNYLYLNIKKVLKPESKRLYDENGETTPKLQKLEVKDINEEDLYDTTLTIYDIREDRQYSMDELTPRFKLYIDEILNANSSNREDEIKQWEQEIYPCAHSIDLEQVNSGTIDLTQCSQCDLKENLWICLHCGALGCGRQQFGSSIKGNSHALSHFEMTNHPVAIKLGSLSNSEESCDAYCYNCNDEVKVPNLAVKLLKFGIDLKTSVKTEKSLIELNIDQNMNWDFQLDGANGEKLTPVYGEGLTGLQNLGNSCYLNSVLQALFSLQTYQEYFKNLEFPPYSKDSNPAQNLTVQLLKIYDGLLSGRYSKPGSLKGDDYQVGIKPGTFKALIGESHPEFSTQRQQDASEFLAYLLDKIDSEFGLQVNEPFKYLMEDKVTCATCSHGRIKHELVDNITLKIADEVESIEDGKKIYKEVDLIDSFKDYSSPESIEGYSCIKCETNPGLAIKSTGFKTFPQYLIVNAQRIKLENWVPVKLDVPIKIPYDIDLAAFKSKGMEEGEIELQESDDGDNEDDKFAPNADAMATLLGMGFPEPRCKRGLFNTGNSNAEDAMNWIFAHMDDVDIDTPFEPSATPSEPTISEESIQNLSSMGFSQQLATKALTLCSNDVNAAVEWLFSNPEDNGLMDKKVVNLAKDQKELTKKLLNTPPSNTKYQLQSVICHKGTSPHTGHYVVFIRKQIQGEYKWVLFNDEKVVVCDETNLDDIKNNGYVYVFEQVKT